MNVVDCALKEVDFYCAPVEATAHQILELLELKEVELSILLCNNDFIQILNRDYRGKDYPTDVLSFSQRESALDPMLGDVIISVEKATTQANEQDRALSDELSLLLVHGVLHLLGYDHEEDEEAEEMEAKERAILSQLQVEWDAASR